MGAARSTAARNAYTNEYAAARYVPDARHSRARDDGRTRETRSVQWAVTPHRLRSPGGQPEAPIRRSEYAEAPLLEWDDAATEALERASAACQLATVEALLKSRKKDRRRVAVGLRSAALAGECEAVELLLAHDSKAAAVTDAAGRSPLHFAALSGGARAPDVAALLVFANPRGVAPDRRGETPVHAASRAGREVMVRVLVGGGADASSKNVDGEDACRVAATAGHGSIVAYLRSVVTTSANDTERIVAIWECFFENAARRAFEPAPRRPRPDAERRARRRARGTARARRERPPAPAAVRTAWREAWSADHGRLYYVDEGGHSVWDRPSGVGDEVEGDGCGGWRRCWDDDEASYYYADPGGAARWVAPAALADALESSEWTECYDASTGETYRHSRTTGGVEGEARRQNAWRRVVAEGGGEPWYRDEAGARAWDVDDRDGAYAATAEWVEVDAAEPYWLHEPSGTVRWRRPVARAAADDGVYFLDLATGTATWEPPEDAEDLLSAEWAVCYSANATDPAFYYSDRTRVSRWDPPWLSPP